MSATPTTSPDQSWVGRNGWLLAAVWLVFLVFPLLTILADDGAGAGTKVAATLLLTAFAGTYIDGFRRQHHREQQALRDSDRPSGHGAGGHTAGRAHFVALLALALTLSLVAGVAGLGVASYVVAFAVFHFRWPSVWVVIVAGLAVTIVVPLRAGVLSQVWFFPLIVLVVGGAAVLIRVVEGHQFDQAQLQTRLALSDERSRVARDVHDVLGHSLTAVILKVELCQRLLEDVEPEGQDDRRRVETCRQQLAELDSIGRSALTEIRATVGGLRATNLADEVTVARTVLADAGVDLLVTGDVTDVPAGHRSMLAWVVREAVTNVVRHARAGRCHIELDPEPGPVLLRVTDDGIGLGTSGEGNGLRGLRERVSVAGAVLRVEPGDAGALGTEWARGTRIEVTV